MINNIKMNRPVKDKEPNSYQYCEEDSESSSGENVTNGSSAIDIHPKASSAVKYSGEESEKCLQCENCRATFKSKGLYEKHVLFCATLAGMRNVSGGQSGGGSGSGCKHESGRINKKYTVVNVHDDALLPSPKEMFMLIQELTLKYNKVKDELDVIKTWAKMVGRRIGGGGNTGGAVVVGGSDPPNSDFLISFSSLSRQKRQNMEMILNEDDAAMCAAALSTGQPSPLDKRPTFALWYSSFTLNQEHLDYVFQSDLVSGIVSILLKIVSEYTNESGKSHLIPFKFTDVKQGSFYIYDAPFSHDAPVLPQPQPQPGDEKRWRFIEPFEFQLMVNSVHKLLLKEFKKWQDRNWELQSQITKQKQKATLSYENVMSSFQCSPAMASCDGEYYSTMGATTRTPAPGAGAGSSGDGGEPNTPPSHLNDVVLSEDFASLYNKYADKVMGGALTPDTIITRVRAKLWKDMKAWML
jgi:hypothetical protein